MPIIELKAGHVGHALECENSRVCVASHMERLPVEMDGVLVTEKACQVWDGQRCGDESGAWAVFAWRIWVGFRIKGRVDAGRWG